MNDRQLFRDEPAASSELSAEAIVIPPWGIVWANVRAAAEPLTLSDVLNGAAMADTKGITQRYREERTRRGMQRRPWPLLPEEPVEPWERLPIPLLCRLLHEPLIVERLIDDERRLVMMPRFAYRVVESPWRFHVGVVP